VHVQGRVRRHEHGPSGLPLRADPSEYEEDEAKTLKDIEYGRIACDMSFVEGTLHYEIYRQI
jgi:hypothetical protein